MTLVEGEIVIRRPVEEVFDFVADERNEPRYNPRMVAADLVSEGPVRSGSRFRAELRTAGRTMPMSIEYTEFDRPRRLASATHSALIDTVGGITFEPVAPGTQMRWSWEVRPRGPLRLLPSVVGLIGRRQEQTIWGNLKRLLESSAAPAPMPTPHVGRLPDALRLACVMATAPVARRPVRPYGGEAGRSLASDALVPHAKLAWTHAITIDAPAGEVWPWLVQMGCRRAGWYSYDGLDNGGVPSANRIVPALQHAARGDIFPMTPTATDGFVVRASEPQRALVLGDAMGSATWALVLEPIDEARTRLITRVRATYDRAALGVLLKAFWRPIHFGMQRRQLLNLKQLAETAAR